MTTQLPRRRFLQSTLAGAAAVVSFDRMLAAGLYAAPADEGWIELFDGKTLSGWHKNPQKIGHGTGGRWAVEDGVIAGEQDPPGSGNGGILLTDRKFGDFEVSIDMKPDWGVCSGLFLRSNDRGQCLQMMVDYHDAGDVGHIYGEGVGGFTTRTFEINGVYNDAKELIGLTTDKHTTAAEVGLVSSCTPEAFVKAWKLDGWNTARVRVAGKYPHITTWVNDVQVCEFDGEKSSNEQYRKDRDTIVETLGTKGSIAVQVHGGNGWPKGAKCRWKNVRVREL